MSETTPHTDKIELLIKTQAALRTRDNDSPAQILVGLNLEIDKVVIPSIDNLDQRALAARIAVDGLVTSFIRGDYQATEKASEKFEQDRTTVNTIGEEVEGLRKEISSLPRLSPRRVELAKALDLRSVELDLISKRIDRYTQTIEASIERVEGLRPEVSELHELMDSFKNRFLRAAFWLVFWGVVARIVSLLWLVLALVTTILVDRATTGLDWLSKEWAGLNAHDLVILLLCVVQTVAFTLFVERFIAWLCWGSFDRTIGVLSRILPEVRDVETQLRTVEAKIIEMLSSLPAEQST